ncbi:hypothetical protein E4O04_10960 [Treponema sp. OMZ 799]|uniref:hypothetical protein n=1 Tax=unclassified Treponema TaxID=2638727 RepID=UPI0020A565D2|nr:MULTISPECIES: hypothetical protein [unclassified Treponema]UTC67645.1 hypothetical protein E4O06_02950 [Treponema sp. OMZ 789]UTC70373.1 hypothetical protein E4O01_02940 [Treponema sp. OMZ 790]UTC73087.1 hypothetical protein E4O02_02940 [Treponema sp. OMZ 791]UTC78490.1 hypothetical protein E4O04_10960 [Treponema sp. OMZ 799]
MSYEILEKRIKALPQYYYQELVNYLDYLTEKVAKNKALSEEDTLNKMSDASIQTAWEYLKDDTW